MNEFLESMLIGAVSSIQKVSLLVDGTEPLGGGYARQPIVWVVVDGKATNRNELAWSVPRGTYDAVGYHNRAGHLVVAREFDQPVRMTRQGVLKIAAGQLVEELQGD